MTPLPFAFKDFILNEGGLSEARHWRQRDRAGAVVMDRVTETMTAESCSGHGGSGKEGEIQKVPPQVESTVLDR